MEPFNVVHSTSLYQTTFFLSKFGQLKSYLVLNLLSQWEMPRDLLHDRLAVGHGGDAVSHWKYILSNPLDTGLFDLSFLRELDKD